VTRSEETAWFDKLTMSDSKALVESAHPEPVEG